MRTVLKIFKRDFRRAFSNRAAALIMVGVSLLPSLYAWFNIAANIDPYANTQGVKVAIANCDVGKETELLSMNAGENIVESLKKNDKLGWTFVSESQAKEGVKSGKYYAAIVIPKDFSESLLSILSGKLKQPELDYYLNEKKNAIAPKITDSGATTIQQQINDTFSSTASEAISKMVSEAAKKIKGDVDDTNETIINDISLVHKNIEEYNKVLKNFKKTSKSSEKIIDDTIDILNEVNKVADSTADSVAGVSSQITNSREKLRTFNGTFSNKLQNIESDFNDIAIATSTKLTNFENKGTSAKEELEVGIDQVNSLVKRNSKILEELAQLNRKLGNDSATTKIEKQISEINDVDTALGKIQSSLNSGNSTLDKTIAKSKYTREQIGSVAKNGKKSLDGYQSDFQKKTLPNVYASLDGMVTINGNLSSTLKGIKPTVKEAKKILKQFGKSLNNISTTMDNAKETLAKVDEKLEGIVTDLQAISSTGTYEELISLKGIDTEKISDFMASPVDMESEVLYEVKNYGSGMTPFYTNLALWVGGLILVSILKQEVDREGIKEKFSATQGYFGRWLLYVCTAVVQGFIVCVGDLVILRTQCVHPFVFILTGMFLSFVYVNIIFSLAITFKHIGKAVAVLLVILQIPGSSGTYPIEMMPDFFQKLHPLMPFTYGINAMRECVAGYYGHIYLENMIALVVFIILALFVGLVIRPLILNLNNMFDKELAKTDLMLCETATATNKNKQLQMIARAILQDEYGRKQFLEKSAKFEKNYQKKIKIGFINIIIIPLVFLILMFSLESKLVFLILWILSIIILAVYLICVEYIHNKIQKQIKVSGFTSEEFVKVLKEEKDT